MTKIPTKDLRDLYAEWGRYDSFNWERKLEAFQGQYHPVFVTVPKDFEPPKL